MTDDQRPGTCEIRWCRAENQPLIYVNEISGDASYCVDICRTCADILGLKQGDDLPVDVDAVRRKLKAAREDDQ